MKERILKVKIPDTRFRRWRFLEEGNERVLLIDFRCIRADKAMPINYGARRRTKWNNPEHLKSMVDEYFASCFGVIYNPKTGMPFYNADGTLRKGQIKPFTISGLALYIHVDTCQIKNYSDEKINELGFPTDEDYTGPQYSDIIREARKRIEAFAEENLYNRDGFNGGKFVLNCAFGWQDRMEAATIQNMKKQQKMKKKELELKKSVLEGDDGDEPVTINIIRAQKKEG